ncbi:hypothetical protein VDG1235_615 [Verrucomicrobiia bacterium DG1235]|nr:hypothetical protein VDG1235_615 [Verrucomicrobiae bacterium DG1235]
MTPFLTPGDVVTIEENAYAEVSPARFEIVALKLEHPPFDRRILRVVGLPGEHVEITEAGIQINKKPIKLPSQSVGSYYVELKVPTFLDIKLQENEYYVLGDNPDHSFDSRFFGKTTQTSILGKVTKE